MREPRLLGRNSLDSEDGCAVGGDAERVSVLLDMLAKVGPMGGRWHMAPTVARIPRAARRGSAARLERGIHGRDLRSR